MRGCDPGRKSQSESYPSHMRVTPGRRERERAREREGERERDGDGDWRERQ